MISPDFAYVVLCQLSLAIAALDSLGSFDPLAERSWGIHALTPQTVRSPACPTVLIDDLFFLVLQGCRSAKQCLFSRDQ